ncbi:unnamed protein product [Colias eurytheme]|nr:unnamed protein product [Colias eurytheme]
MITPWNACLKPYKFVIIVTSYVGHVELRSAHRRSMPIDYLRARNVTRFFLLARIPETERYITQEAILDESNTFGDILQGSFYEDYRNLTYKNLMGLQYASSECNGASYILKVDDDTVFNFELTHNFLSKLPDNSQNPFMLGYMLNSTLPIRLKQNKWYVTYEEYPLQKYPSYLSGWYYITNPKTAAMICDEAPYHPYFWIDDILITGILTEYLNIRIQQLPRDYWLEHYELLECCLRDMVKKKIKCNYVVGPNGGRHNLIVEFNDAYTSCTNCAPRSITQKLNETCVMFRDRTIFSDGKAEVHHIKL